MKIPSFARHAWQLVTSMAALAGGSAFAQPLDTLVFGSTASETAHALVATSTETLIGALGEPARRALPLSPVDIYGGSFTFTMTVDPVRRNYVTVKLWGGDDTDILKGRFYLYVPISGTDYQVGYRHEGDYMPLSVTGTKPPLPGRFFYSTTLLPLSMTQGKTSLTLKIVSTGRLYGLGSGVAPTGNYQFLMDRASRGLYRAYTHVDAFLDPTGEVQGSAPATITRPTPGEEVMSAGGGFFNGVTNRINNRLAATVNVTNFTTADVEYLAKSYSVSGLVSYQNSAVVSKVVAVIDAFATDYYTNPSTAVSTGGNEGWGGRFGNLGRAIHLLSAQLAPYLDVTANYGATGGDKIRRAAWGDLLYASREFGRTTRDNRAITNQTTLADESIYKANKGLLTLGDARAFTETDAQRYLKEACGLLPWLGSDLAAGGSSKKFGSSYYQVTSKGLTREWGYVGNAYGEMTYHIADWYQISGNVEFLNQAAKMAKARAAFRRPSMIVSGSDYYRTMEAIGLLAWRGVDESDGDYEDAISYGDSSEWTRGMRVAAVTGDAALIGYAKQMLADNQYFRSITSDSRYYAVVDALNAFVDYQTVKAAADNGTRLPMTDGQPDFGWADEEDRILALKRGNDRLWIAPYWQAKSGTGINGIARFHFSTSTYDQYGVLETTPQFTFGGSFTRPASYIDKPEATQWGPPTPPTQAYGNEVLPLGPTPSDASDDQPFRGKADFYAFRFGNYLIGLNAHASSSYTLKTPAGFSSATELLTNTTASGTITVAPKSTVALYLASAADAAPIPNAPLFISATGASGAMNVAWSAGSGATSYTVKRSTAFAGPFTTLASGVTTTSYSDNTVTAGTTYYYVVTAVNANGSSYDSMVATGLTLGLPAPWSDADIGNVTTAGSASYNAGVYTIKGAGTDIGGTSDAFHFGYQPLSGDGAIIARLATRVIGGATNDKVGLMIRDGIAANSPMAWVFIDAGSGLSRFAYRSTAGGGTTNVNGTAITVPRWFKLQRTGNVFTGSVSADGATWTVVSSTTMTLSASLNVGFAVCSRDAAVLDSSTFDNVSIVQPPVITSATAIAAPVNQVFTYTITATNSPTSFSATGLPAGLSLNTTTGVISGTPTSSATSNITLGATNAAGTSTATLLLQVAPLPIVSVHFKRPADAGMKTTDLAGAQRADRWVNMNGPVSGAQTQTLSTLTDNTGATVAGMAMSVTGGTGFNTVQLNSSTSVVNEQALFAHTIDQQNGTAGTFAITGIPFPTYDAYVYLYGDQSTSNDRGGSVTANGTTYYIRTGASTRISATDGTGYLRSTDTVNNGATATLGNYVRFTGLSGNLSASYVALNMGSTVQRLKIVGVQIVATSLPAPGTVAPSTPTGLTLTSGNNQVSLAWNAVVGATTYTVKRGTSAAGPFTTLASGLTTTAYTDATAVNGATYYYVVSASNAVGESANTSASSAVTPSVPSTPVALSFDLRTSGGKKMLATDLAGAARFANWNGFVGPTGGGQTVALSGAVVDSNGAAVTGLSVSMTSGSTGSTFDRDGALNTTNDPMMFNSVLDQLNGTASTLTITGVPYSTYDAYVYVYWDENSTGANDRGGRVTANGATYYLRTGTATKITANDGTGYIQSTDTNAAVGSSTQLGNYVKFSGLTGNLSANFVALNMGASVQRLKIAGFQIVSPSTPTVSSAPAAPSGVQALQAPSQVTVQWSPSNTATSYTVKRSTSAGGPFAAIGTVTAANNLFVDTTVTNGTTYFYVVSATNAIGTSADSAAASATPIDPTTLAAFSVKLRAYNTYGMPVTDAAGVLRLNYWNNLVGPAVTGETVSTSTLTNHLGIPLSGVTATWTAGTTGGSYTNSGTLKFGTDAVTVGPASNDLNVYSSAFDQYDGTASTLTITGIPFASYDAIFYVYDGGGTQGGTITTNGSTLAIRGGAGAPDANGSGYVRSTDSTNTSGASVQQGNYVRFTGLTGNLTASFLATNVGSSTQRLKIAGFQIISNAAVPAPSAVPVAPGGLTASAGNTQVGLNWSHTATATSYKIYKAGSLLATVASPLTSYADTAVTNGASASYTVSAVNAVGEGTQSASVSATPAAPGFTLPQRTVYQYSLPMTPIFGSWTVDPQRRAYLWVPPGTTKLQGVVVGLHNMLEKPMFDDAAIRQACADADLGILFISAGDSKTWTPNGVGNYTSGPVTMCLDLDPNNYVSADINSSTGTNYATDINPATGTRFTSQAEQASAELAALLNKFAVESGYTELQYAPVLMTGHSAASPFVWTRGVHASAALSGRVFAIMPYKGGFAGSAPSGIPIFHTASEWQEISNWGNTWELGDAPAMRGLRAGGADRLLGEYVQPGTGHYQYSESLSGPLATFIRKSAHYRIPANWNATAAPTLNTIDPTSGYLVDVTKVGSGNCQPVSYAAWTGAGKDPLRAYWYFDAETAQAVCDAQNAGFAKRPQMINGFQNATTLAPLASQTNGTGYVSLTAALQGDGVTFKVQAAAMNRSPVSRLFNGAPVGIASGSILFKANGSGALKQTGADTFRVWMDRGTIIKEGQPWEPFVIARHPGDANFREADRPIFVTTSVPVNNITGATQTITFPGIPDQVANNLQPLTLNATASSGLPVQYWVVSGPYRNDETDSAVLIPDQFPGKPTYPIRVVVGAWQWGQPGTTAAATAVFKEFFIQQVPPTITSAATASGTFGSAFSYTITATNTPTSFTATGLPSGLTLDTTTGVISGTPMAAGNFAVPLGATNGGGTGSATLTLTVETADAAFNAWAAALPAGLRGPSDDPDGDGLPNLVEFVAVLNGGMSQTNLGTIGTIEIGGTTYPTFTYLRRSALGGARIDILVSPDLAFVSDLGLVEISATQAGAGFETIVVRSAAPFSAQPRQFFRLDATLP